MRGSCLFSACSPRVTASIMGNVTCNRLKEPKKKSMLCWCQTPQHDLPSGNIRFVVPLGQWLGAKFRLCNEFCGWLPRGYGKTCGFCHHWVPYWVEVQVAMVYPQSYTCGFPGLGWVIGTTSWVGKPWVVVNLSQHFDSRLSGHGHGMYSHSQGYRVLIQSFPEP